MLLCCAVDLVLLGPCFARRHCRFLICRDLGKVLGEICFNDLQEGDDATRRTVSSLVRRICRIIIVQDLQSKLDSSNSLLQLGLVSVERRLLLSAEPVHLCLSLGQLRELVLQCGNLLLQLCRLGGRAVNPGADLLDFVCFLRLLCVRLFQLLVAIGLLGGICSSLLLQTSNHVRNQPLHLVESTARLHGCGHPLCKLGQRPRPLLACEITDKTHCLVPVEVPAGCHLDESRRRSSCGLHNNLPGLCKYGQLLVTALALSRICGSSSLALLTHLSLGGRILAQLLCGHIQITLGCRLALRALRDPLLGRVHVFLSELDLVLERLPQHLVIVPCINLLFAQICQLSLGLPCLPLLGVDDPAALALVYGSSWGTRSLVLVSILSLLRRLQQCRQLGCVAGGDHRCLDHHVQGLGEAASILQLHHCCAT